MNNQNFKRRCMPIENLFLTGIPEIDNDPILKRKREEIINPKSQKKNTKSIYIIKFTDGIIKIGVSKDPEKRIRTIERNSGRLTKNKYITEPINNSFQIENKLKNKFKENNIKGEFYNLDFDTVIYFVNKFLKEVV